MIVDQLPVLPAPKVSDEIPIERGTNLYKITVNGLLTTMFTVEDEQLVIGNVT